MKETVEIEETPADINFETRKNIIRQELNKIYGKPRIKEAKQIAKQLNKKEHDKKRKRRHIASASRRRNRG